MRGEYAKRPRYGHPDCFVVQRDPVTCVAPVRLHRSILDGRGCDDGTIERAVQRVEESCRGCVFDAILDVTMSDSSSDELGGGEELAKPVEDMLCTLEPSMDEHAATRTADTTE